jgi:hypothetical protein
MSEPIASIGTTLNDDTADGNSSEPFDPMIALPLSGRQQR